MPTREIYWNIAAGWVVYPLMLLVLAAVAYGFYGRYRRWQVGRQGERLTDLRPRLRSLLIYGLVQRRVLHQRFAGIMHLLIFGGFLVLFVGTLLVAVHEDLRLRILEGQFYLVYSFALDVAGAAAIVGLLMAAFRRYVVRAQRLDRDRGFALAIAFGLLVLVTGFLVEGTRIAADELVRHLDWAIWSPVGLLVAWPLRGMDAQGLRSLHAGLWWLHMLSAFGLLAYAAFGTLAHVLLSPANIALRSLRTKGVLQPIDFERGVPFGVGNIADLTRQELFELDACARCGRCQEYCPAHLSGKTLSPRSIVQALKGHLIETAPLILKQRQQGVEAIEAPPLVGPGAPIAEADLWACTTCRVCAKQCPVFVEVPDKIIELRRHQALVANQIPESAQLALRNMEIRGHPWSGAQLTRTGWAKQLGIPEAAEAPGVELLYWVGCTGALVERNTKVTVAMAQLLKLAGVEFAILGEEEVCCGDPARRLGAELQFHMQAQQNVELLRGYGVKKVLTHCPHCYHTLKNEYPQYGAEFTVVHHTELLSELFAQGRLKPAAGVESGLVFHDSCYLGRYNGLFDQPRQTLAALTAGGFLEMERRRGRSFCCGAGGGHAWMEEQGGRRINHMRVEEAVRVGGNGIVSACPFCLQMFEDGRAAAGLGEEFVVQDIAEVVYRAVAAARAPVVNAPDRTT